MATQEVIQARIDALEEALASGELSVRHGEKSVTYRSVEEIRTALATLRGQLSNRRVFSYFKLGGR